MRTRAVRQVSTGVTEPSSRCASPAETRFDGCEPAGPPRSGKSGGPPPGWLLQAAGIALIIADVAQGGLDPATDALTAADLAELDAVDTAGAEADTAADSAPAAKGASGAEDGTPIYRGVARNHNAFGDAQQGIASPGDVAGHADVYAHNVLDDTWTSRLTSWSTEREVAQGFAGKNGVILETTIEEMQASGVNILESPDYFDESEILLEGTIDGLQVTQP